MSPSHATARGKRYRYYVSQTDDPATRDEPVFRVSAHDLEGRVSEQLAGIIKQQACTAIHGEELGADQNPHGSHQDAPPAAWLVRAAPIARVRLNTPNPSLLSNRILGATRMAP